MSKLHAKEKPVTVSKMEDNTYHCCRWCHWYDKKEGICTCPAYQGSDVFSINSMFINLVEEGRLDEALTEALHSDSEGEDLFETALTTKLYGWNMSDKRVKEFKKVFREVLDQYLDQRLKEVLDAQVSTMIRNTEKDASCDIGGTFIAQPETHYCREFW